jgi:hypothetical protein
VKGISIKRLFIASLAGLALALPLAGLTAPDEAQKTLIQKAKPREGMSPQQMREWIDEHLKLMDQMMGENHMMMQGGGMQGMGGHDMGKK